MGKKKSLKTRIDSYLYEHLVLRIIVQESITFFMCFLSAFIFAFGFKAFLSPSLIDAETGKTVQTLVSGGASGISQIIGITFQLIFGSENIDTNLVYMFVYFLVNIPLVILAFTKIGKRFSIYTLLNVAFVSLLVNYMNFDFLNDVASFVTDNGGLLARSLFAGICTGLSSAIAFKAEISAGGIDIISYYVSLKKSTPPGRYSVYINSVIVFLFATLSTINLSEDASQISYIAAQEFAGILFSTIYMFTAMLVIDSINVRNKKQQIQIITENEDVSKYLIANFPHSTTLVKGKGGYTGKDKVIIYMVVSTFEANKVIKLVEKVDPRSFINVMDLRQVYGAFFIKPIK